MKKLFFIIKVFCFGLWLIVSWTFKIITYSSVVWFPIVAEQIIWRHSNIGTWIALGECIAVIIFLLGFGVADKRGLVNRWEENL